MNKRQRAVREYLLGECTYLQLEKKYGISHATLNRCVLKYKAQQQAKLKGVGLSSDPMKPKPNQPPTIEQLQKLLEQERLRNKLLNVMLDIAEDELHQQRGDLRRRWKNYYKKREVELEVAS